MQTSLFDGVPDDRDAGDDPGAPEDRADSCAEGEDASVDAAEDPSRKTFAVGRLTARQAETELLTPGDSPLPGPWRVKAVVEDRGTAEEAGGEGMGSAGGTRPESPSTPARRLPELLQRLGGGALVDALRRLLNAVRQ